MRGSRWSPPGPLAADTRLTDTGRFAPLHTELERAAAPPIDEVIVAPHPPGVSRWLTLDAPSRIRAIPGLPVTHVIVPPVATVADDRALPRLGG